MKRLLPYFYAVFLLLFAGAIWCVPYGTPVTVDFGADSLTVKSGVSGAGGTVGSCPDYSPGFNCGPDEVDVYTVMLYHFDGRGQGGVGEDFEDCSGSTYWPHNLGWRNNQGVTEEADSAYFGASGISLVGTNYFEIADDFDQVPRTAEFAFDAWIRIPSTVDANYRILFSSAVANSDFELASHAGKLAVFNQVHGWQEAVGGADLRDDTWHHWGVCRSGTTLLFFVDGVKTHAVPGWNDDVYDGHAIPFQVGYDLANPKFIGDVDELRWSIGTSRWDENFTPPTAPY